MKNLFCLIFLFFTIQLSAQKDTSLKISSLVGGNISTGNWESYSGNLKFQLNKDWKNSELNWSPSFQFSEVKTDGTFSVKEKEFFSNFNFIRNTKNFKIYLNNDLEHSLLQKVDLRASMGIGLGTKIINKSRTKIGISQLIMPEFLMSNFGNLYDNFAIRSSTRLKVILENDKSTLNFVCFYQPSLLTYKGIGNSIVEIPFKNNILFRSNLSLETKIWKSISIGITNSINYESYSNSIDKSIKPIDTNFYFFTKIN